MLASIQVDVKIVTWLRYTAWIPLYPLGMLFEGKSIIVVSAYKIYHNNHVYDKYLSQRMRFPTMWYVRPAKPQISLPICAV